MVDPRRNLCGYLSYKGFFPHSWPRPQPGVGQPLADHAGGKCEMSVGSEDFYCQHEMFFEVEELLELLGRMPRLRT